MNRQGNLQKLRSQSFDICIVGGGASGVGCAIDAALRGLKVALIEKNDFAAETSSKSTKLIHGGVRYLEQAFKQLDFGQLRQVKHGLEERHILLKNAPHLAHSLGLITPVFSWIEGFYFTIGLKLYGLFAKNDTLPKAQWLSRKASFEHIPNLSQKIHSSVLYYDGQLDDARYCVALAQTADEAGAAMLNHAEVIDFQKDNDNKITSATVLDHVSGEEFLVKSQLFINCTGAFADGIRNKANITLSKRIRASKGVHIMVSNDFLESNNAMLIPKTKDGRVVFVIPFEGKVMIGTTDDEYTDIDQEPILEQQEVDYLIDTVRPFLKKTPAPTDVKAGFGGLRPLVVAAGNRTTKRMLRDHEVEHDQTSNLISLLGGKWTTYRLMAKDTIDKACEILNCNTQCSTENQILAGGENFDIENWKVLHQKYNLDNDICQHLNQKYGSRAEEVLKFENFERILPQYPFIEAEVFYAARFEMAYSLRDFFARRIRLEIISWEHTLQAIPKVADLMAKELGWSEEKKAIEIENYSELLQKFKEKIAKNIRKCP